MNELFEASRVLDELGLCERQSHPRISNLENKECLLVEVSEKGIPEMVKLLPREQTVTLKRYAHGNQSSFPAIRAGGALLQTEETETHITNPSITVDPDKLSTFIQQLKSCPLAPAAEKYYIADDIKAELMELTDTGEPTLAALKQLVAGFPEKKDAKIFAKHLVEQMLDTAATTDNPHLRNCILNLLCNKNTVVVYFDVYETLNFPTRVSSSETWKALIGSLDEQTGKGQEVISPFTGKPVAGKGDNYAAVKVPGIGKVLPYSNNKMIPCLRRYGKVGIEAFDTGSVASAQISDTLSYLTSPERKRMTWDTWPVRKNEYALILAYMAGDPTNKENLAEMLSDPVWEASPEQIEEAGGLYDALCSQILGNMKSRFNRNPDFQINLALIEKLDDGRQQIVYQDQFSVKRYWQNLQKWVEGVQNAPPLNEKLTGMKKSVSRSSGSTVKIPGPRQINDCFRYEHTAEKASPGYRNALIRAGAIQSLNWRDIYRLYMPRTDAQESDEAFNAEVLEKTMLVGRAYLRDCMNGIRLSLSFKRKNKENGLDQYDLACYLIFLISITLQRMNIRKEHYMEQVAYNLGQLLHLADLLHSLHCYHVQGKKGKDGPARFLGNEFLNIMAEQPLEGINRLRERMAFYLGWARTACGMKRVAGILNAYERIAPKVASGELPETFGPKEQALVFLGYIGEIPETKESEGLANETE